MEEYLATRKYLPTKEFFRPTMKEKHEGYFTDFREEKSDQSDSSKTLEMMISDVNEMEDLIKDNYLQSEVKKKEFFN